MQQVLGGRGACDEEKLGTPGAIGCESGGGLVAAGGTLHKHEPGDKSFPICVETPKMVVVKIEYRRTYS